MANGQRRTALETFVASQIHPVDEWRQITVRFLRDHVARSPADGVVVGISGGIDSSLTAALCVEALGAAQVLGVMMPHAASNPADLVDGAQLMHHLGIEGVTRDITAVVAGIPQAGEMPAVALGNAKARARMMVLYAEAHLRGRLVCGTGNKSELLVGYFTKYGDGGVDLEPIGDLYKTQVFELAAHLGLPENLVKRTPSAGLVDGQTDEADLGISYEALDSILKGIELNASADAIVRRTGATLADVKRVIKMVRASEHKRHAPLVPKIGARTVGIDWRRSVHWDAD
jgi:NAD+ synthase